MTDTKIHLCNTCEYAMPECEAKHGDLTYGDSTGNDNITVCPVYVLNHELQKEKVERLKEIKEQFELLSTEKKEIENILPEQVIYQNPDNTWTRWTRTDNLKELQEKGEIFRAAPVNRYTTKLEPALKGKPKELN